MAVKSFNATDKTQLSKHFNVQEFRCKCGRTHQILIDTKVIEMLENLISTLGADKCNVSSGYRCEAHDKAVGGTGRGQHTKGKAADVCFYKDGKPISTKIVSCRAQDMGIPGIANITAAYTYIHLDVRESGRYYGNEFKSPNTVTNDFYAYYNIKRDSKTNTDVEAWQNAAIADGFKFPKSGADGLWGSECLSVSRKAVCKRHPGGYKNKNLTKIVQKIVGVKVDGYFGEETEKAVKEYQRKNGLEVDGAVGPATWKKMLNIK